MTATTGRVRPFLSRMRQSIVVFWQDMARDYRAATNDMLQVCRSEILHSPNFEDPCGECKDMWLHKVRSVVLCSGAAGLVYSTFTVPSLQHYTDTLVQYNQQLLLLGDTERNAHSSAVLAERALEIQRGTVQHYNLLLCAVLVPTPNGLYNQLYASKCTAIQPTWTDWIRQIRDVGVCGYWIGLYNDMKHYDVHQDCLQ